MDTSWLDTFRIESGVRLRKWWNKSSGILNRDFLWGFLVTPVWRIALESQYLKASREAVDPSCLSYRLSHLLRILVNRQHPWVTKSLMNRQSIFMEIHLFKSMQHVLPHTHMYATYWDNDRGKSVTEKFRCSVKYNRSATMQVVISLFCLCGGGAHACVCVCTCVNVHVWVSTCVHRRTCICVFMFMCGWLCISAGVHVCVHMWVPVHEEMSTCVCRCTCKHTPAFGDQKKVLVLFLRCYPTLIN